MSTSLGAKVLRDHDRSRATYVIHSGMEIPSSKVQEYDDVPKMARHVCIGWLEASAAASRIQETNEHAVELAADYCTCPCSCRHQ